MKKTALPIAFLAALALSACGEKPASTATAPAADPAAAADAKPARTAKPGTPLATPMPQGLALTFPYHLRSDRQVESSKGKTRRIVRIEALDANVGAARKAVLADLRTAGFRPTVQTKDLPKSDDGSIRQVFTRKGWKGTVTVAVAPLGKKSRHPAAGSTVTFTWQGDGVGAAAATAATEPAPAAEPSGE